MATRKKTTNIDSRNDQAAKTAAAITAVISQIQKSRGLKSDDGKTNINIHIGDIILIGFDEAIDAEEWGMRENNTEIIGANASKGNAQKKSNSDAGNDENRKTTRSIKFKKGSLELNAIENSEPASKKPTAKRTTKKVARKSPVKHTTKKVARKVPLKRSSKKRTTHR